MLTTKNAIAIITEYDDAKRNIMIDKLNEDDVRNLAKVLAKSARDSLGSSVTEDCE